jgi:CO/xanthine dehydrogenase FAD-binding subunit
VARRWPLLTQALAHVGHAAIRSRGTIGGSVAHADPRAELPVALTALDARFHLRAPAGERTVRAAEMFAGPYATAVGDGELLLEVVVPAPPPGARMIFAEFARTHGDFALAGVALVLAPGVHAAIALLGAAAVPVRAAPAERALLDGADAGTVARLAGAEVGAGHRRALLTALTQRAVAEAMA